jgi:hypothetical protein
MASAERDRRPDIRNLGNFRNQIPVGYIFVLLFPSMHKESLSQVKCKMILSGPYLDRRRNLLGDIDIPYEIQFVNATGYR